MSLGLIAALASASLSVQAVGPKQQESHGPHPVESGPSTAVRQLCRGCSAYWLATRRRGIGSRRSLEIAKTRQDETRLFSQQRSTG